MPLPPAAMESMREQSQPSWLLSSSDAGSSWMQSHPHLSHISDDSPDPSLDGLLDSVAGGWVPFSSLSPAQPHPSHSLHSSIHSSSTTSLFHSPSTSFPSSPSYDSSLSPAFTFPPPSSSATHSSSYPPASSLPPKPSPHPHRASHPWPRSPTVSPPSCDFTSPRSFSSSSSSSTPISPLVPSHRTSHVFSHGLGLPHSSDASRPPLPYPPTSTPPPIFSSSRVSPPPDPPRLLPLSSSSLPFPSHPLKVSRLPAMRKARKAALNPLSSSHPPPGPSFSSGPYPRPPTPAIASALPSPYTSSHLPPSPAPPRRKSSRKSGVMIDVPIKMSPSSSSPPKRKLTRALPSPTPGDGQPVVATVSPLQGERTMGGVAIASAVPTRGAAGAGHLAALLAFDRAFEGQGRTSGPDGGDYSRRGYGDSGGELLPPNGGFTRQQSAPVHFSGGRDRGYDNGQGEREGYGGYPAASQPWAQPWSDEPYRASGDNGSRQSSHSSSGPFDGQSTYSGGRYSPSFPPQSPNPSDGSGGYGGGQRPGPYLDDATSTAVLSQLAASLSHLQRATSAPAPLQPAMQGVVGGGRGRVEGGGGIPPALLNPQLHPALLAERQAALMRQFRQSNSALQNLSPDATAFLAALSTQIGHSTEGPPQMPPPQVQQPLNTFSPVPRPLSSSSRPPPFPTTQGPAADLRQLQVQRMQANVQQQQQRLQPHAASDAFTQRLIEATSPAALPSPAHDYSHSRPGSSHSLASRPRSGGGLHGAGEAQHMRGLLTPCPLAGNTGCVEMFGSLAELQHHYITTHMMESR